jgi:hypothetical protein
VGRPRPFLCFDSCQLVLHQTEGVGCCCHTGNSDGFCSSQYRASSSSQYLRPLCVRLLVLTGRDLVLLRLHCLLVCSQGARECRTGLRHILEALLKVLETPFMRPPSPTLTLCAPKGVMAKSKSPAWPAQVRRPRGFSFVAAATSLQACGMTQHANRLDTLAHSARLSSLHQASHSTSYQPPGHTCALSSARTCS